MSELPAPAESADGFAATGKANPAAVLRLELFGGPVLWRNNESVRLSPLQTGLFALAFSELSERVPRILLQHLLWESRDQKVVRHRLSQLIYQMNQTLEERLFEPRGEQIRIRRELVQCDLDEFQAFLDAEEFPRAGAMAERGFLAACGYRKTDAFADWIEEQRLQKRLHLRRTALAAWEEAELDNDWVRARRAAQVLLRLEPREEEILRRVMWARVMCGQVREAEVEYRRFARRAAPGGQWVPEPATTTLLDNVHALAQEKLERQSGPVGGIRDAPGQADFVGRSRELTVLNGKLFKNRDATGWRTVSVSGEAGIGKTRLLQEVLRSARFRGHRVLQTSATPLEREIALGSILEPLTRPWVLPVLQSLAEPWRTTAQLLLPGLRDPDSAEVRPSPAAAVRFDPGSHGAEGPSRPICEALLHLLAAIARRQPTILLLDAVQWFDSASIGVLQFLRRRWSGGPFTLLMTHRPEELRLGCAATRFVQDEEYAADSVVIRIRELNREDAGALIRSVSPGLARSSLKRIAWMADGNPQYIIDLAREWSGRELSRSPEALPVPGSVRRVVARRVESMDGAPRRVLFALAVIGESAPLSLLHRVAGVGSETCMDALDVLHRLRLAIWTPQGVKFRRPVFGAAAYREIHPSRRGVLHARTARILQATSQEAASDVVPALVVARHYHRAGKRRHADECVLEAVREAESEAIPKRIAVLEAARGLTTGPHKRAILAVLVRSHYDMRKFGTVVRCGEAALRDGAGLSAMEGFRTRCLVTDARRRLGVAGEEETLTEFNRLEEAAIALDAGALRVDVHDARVQLLRRAGMRDGLEAELAGLREQEPQSTPEVRCRILAALTVDAAHENPEDWIDCGRRAVELADSLKLHRVAAVARQRHCTALMTAGHLGMAPAWEEFCDHRTVIEDAGRIGLLALVLLDLAEWYLVSGDLDVAGRTLVEVSKITRDMDCSEILARKILVRGGLAVARGDLVEARSVLEVIAGIGSEEEEAPRTPIPPPAYIASLAALKGLLLLELGKLHGVDRIAEEYPLNAHIASASLPSILLHIRLRARTGDPAGALELLAPALEANRTQRPLVWLKLALETVRLARRMREPQPDLAREAHDCARELGLAGVADELLSFCRPDDVRR